MKKVYLSLLLLTVFALSNTAQTPLIYGLDCNGGSDGKGQLFSIDSNFSALTPVQEMNYLEGYLGPIRGKLCQANNGKHYGFNAISDRNRSTIFEYNELTNEYKTVYVFDRAQFTSPMEHLVKAANGEMYGVANTGDNNQYGVIFKFNPQNYAVSLVHSFVASNQDPRIAPIIASNNKLYGATYGGWSHTGEGSFYEYDIATNTFRDIYHFDESGNNLTGWYRGDNSPIVEGPDSCIYGVREGAMPYYGRLYKYNTITDTLTRIYQFDTRQGNRHTIYTNLMFVNNWLYISAGYYSSTMYKMNVLNGSVNIAADFDFNDSLHGSYPAGEMFQSSLGKVSGTLQNGGPNGVGSFYMLDSNLSSIIIKTPFSEQGRMYNPSGRHIFKNDSIILGFTGNQPEHSNYSGYVNRYMHGLGSVYEYNLNSDQIQSKLQFGSSNLGHVPANRLLNNGGTKLYWANRNGGSNFAGTIVEHDMPTATTIKLVDVDSNFIYNIQSTILLNPTTVLGIGQKDTIVKLFEFDLVSKVFSQVQTLNYPPNLYSIQNFGFTKASNNKIYFVAQAKKIYEYDPVSKSLRLVFDLSNTSINGFSENFAELGNSLYAAYTGGIFELNYITDSITYHPYNNPLFFIDYFSPLSAHSNGKLYGLALNKITNVAFVNPTHILEFDPSQPIGSKFSEKAQIEDHKVQMGGSFMEAPNGKFYFQTSTEYFYRRNFENRTKLIEYDVVNNTHRVINSHNNISNCGALNNFVLINSILVGAKEVQQERIRIYPNPAKSVLNIEGSTKLENLRIWSITGTLVLAMENVPDEVNISELSNGIYMVELISDYSREVQRLVIAK